MLNESKGDKNLIVDSKKLKYLVSLVIVLVLFSVSAPISYARADDLIIKDDGTVVLYITSLSGNNVLGASSTQNNKSEGPKPTTPKTEVLVEPKQKSTIQINPPTSNEKKVSVTITTNPVTNSSSQPSLQPTSPVNSESSKPPSVNLNTSTAPPIQKTVDQVVAEDSKGQPVFSIQPRSNNNLSLSQGNTIVSSSLPIQMDNQSHKLSVVTSSGSENIAVLPVQAVRSITVKGLVSDPNNLNINLSQEQNQAIYDIKGERNGRLLGLFYLQSPVEIKFSAQTGKIVSTSESPVFSLLGFWIH